MVSATRGENQYFTRYFIHFPPSMEVNWRLLFRGLAATLRLHVHENSFFCENKKTSIYELVSRYWTTVPSFFPPFNPCTHPTRGHCYYPCFIHGAQRELWMIRCNCRNKSRALDTRVLSVLFSCSVGANCTAQQCLGSDWAISETWLGLPSPPVPPVMWEGSAGMCPFRSPQSID